MSNEIERLPIDTWADKRVEPGHSRNVSLRVGERFSGMTVKVPVHVRRGREDGPAVFITAAVHGNEINGTGAIRELILDTSFRLQRGSLVLVPVVNILGFERHSRYLPDRRDLNRCFPGSATGSLASRLAKVFFDEIVGRCDYGIDLHTAASRRTNFPTVRADTSDAAVQSLAEDFGAEIILDARGPKGSLRRAASAAGCPTIAFEAGEVSKVEPAIVQFALRGIHNTLVKLGMLEGEWVPPLYQKTIKRTKWVRSERGGFLKFHIAPGDIVLKGDLLSSNTSLLGREKHVLTAPFHGVVLGMTTLPATRPGEPVCHLGKLAGTAKAIRALRREVEGEEVLEGVMEDLASSVMVVEPANDS
jgi:predicted deacylase